jgi:hypothetical protein
MDMNMQSKLSWTSMIISAYIIYGASLAGAAGEFDDDFDLA